MTHARSTTSKFTLGLDAGLFGRWARLILGAILPLVSIAYHLVTQPPSVGFYGATALYFIATFGVYLAAHYFLGERLFARTNPWVATSILVGPVVVVYIFQLGSAAFQLALSVYIAISLIFNFVMSYGGCEVMAIPSLIFRRKYVVYCPWNAVDVVDKEFAERTTKVSKPASRSTENKTHQAGPHGRYDRASTVTIRIPATGPKEVRDDDRMRACDRRDWHTRTSDGRFGANWLPGGPLCAFNRRWRRGLARSRSPLVGGNLPKFRNRCTIVVERYDDGKTG